MFEHTKSARLFSLRLQPSRAQGPSVRPGECDDWSQIVQARGSLNKVKCTLYCWRAAGKCDDERSGGSCSLSRA